MDLESKSIRGPSTSSPNAIDLAAGLTLLIGNSSNLSGALNKAVQISFWTSYLSFVGLVPPLVFKPMFLLVSKLFRDSPLGTVKNKTYFSCEKTIMNSNKIIIKLTFCVKVPRILDAYH